MRLVYKGPGSHVMVGLYGRHDKEQEKEYPDKFAKELLETSKRQQFEVVKGPKKLDKEKEASEPTPPPGEEKPQEK